MDLGTFLPDYNQQAMSNKTKIENGPSKVTQYLIYLQKILIDLNCQLIVSTLKLALSHSGHSGKYSVYLFV